MCCGSERGIPKVCVLWSAKYLSQMSHLRAKVFLAFSQSPVSGPSFPNKLFLNSLYLLWFTLNRPLKAQAKVWSQMGDSAARSRVCSEEAVWLEPFLPPLLLRHCQVKWTAASTSYSPDKMFYPKARGPSDCRRRLLKSEAKVNLF